MRPKSLIALCACLVAAAAAAVPLAVSTRTCSTVLLAGAATVLVGHNLDDSIDPPELIVVNPRGSGKRGVACPR